MIEFKEYSQSFTVEDGPKQYGKVMRNGKVFYRNYNRTLKNGKGFSALDLFKIRHAETQRIIRKERDRIAAKFFNR